MTDQHTSRLERADTVLDGLATADSLAGYFGLDADPAPDAIKRRKLPIPPWRYTDDTLMTLSVYANLRQHGEIRQDDLIASLVKHYDAERHYSIGMGVLLSRVRRGEDWQEAARSLFENEGTFGNGSASRAAPIGAYFAGDMTRVITNARLSAEVTHQHPEGINGAIAVACAVAYAQRSEKIDRRDLIDRVMEHIPPGAVRAGLRRARDLPPGSSFKDAISILGNGERITAQDSVPFALWCAAKNIGNYEEATWQAIRAGGDTDTTAAITGAIITAHGGSIPAEWRENREQFPEWFKT